MPFPRYPLWSYVDANKRECECPTLVNKIEPSAEHGVSLACGNYRFPRRTTVTPDCDSGIMNPATSNMKGHLRKISNSFSGMKGERNPRSV
jgi:hypothetical protein